MHFDVAQRISLAGKAISLLELTLTERGLLLERWLCHLPGDHLDFAAVTIADAAADADEIHVQLTGTFQQGLIAGTGTAPSDGFKVNVE